MKAITHIIPLLLLSACGSLQETATVSDDVYDIPDRRAMAAAAAASQQHAADNDAGDAYYDPAEARQAGSLDRGYYDMAYNDPYYYNYGRFGFGTGIGSYGPGYGMGLSYGWPTNFGSMSVGYGFGSGMYGYDPYWGNSWMSGYGMYPYSYYGYGNYGPGYGGYGMGYGPYQGAWGNCYACYEPNWNGSTVYSHRPSMAGGASTGTTTAPRMMRPRGGLLDTGSPMRNQTYSPGRTGSRPSGTGNRPIGIDQSKRSNQSTTRPTQKTRSFDFGGSSPSRSSGNSGGGGGRITSPRPR